MKKKLSLNQIQERELELLCFFKDFCEKYNLRYFLAYGTLLGAVRHKGFIPWDDDVDVCMPRPDYEHFLELSQNTGCMNKYRVVSFEHTEGYIYDFAKMVDIRTDLHENTIMQVPLGVYLDVFPLDGCPSGLLERYSTYFLIKMAAKVHLLTYVGIGKSANHVKHIAKRLVCPLFRKIIGYKRCVRLIMRLSKKKDYETAEKVGVLGAHEALRGIDKKYYDTYSAIIFEEIEFRAPLDPDLVLRNQYGNYMELPPIHKRRTHKIEVYEKKSAKGKEE